MKNTKTIILAVSTFVLWSIDWYLLKQNIFHDQSAALWVWTTLLTILAICVSMFFYLINKEKLISAAVPVMSFVSYIVIMPKNIYVILGGVIFLGLMFLFERRVRAEVKNSLDFSIRRIVVNSISILIYAVLFLIGFNVYYHTANDLKANPDGFYQSLGNTAAKSAPYFTSVLPAGVDFSQTFDEFVADQAKKGEDNFEQNSQYQKNQIIAEYRDQFFKQFQIHAEGNQTLAEIFGNLATEKIKEVSKSYQEYFPFIFAISVVGLLLTFAFVLRWLTLFAAWILFKILTSAGFFKLNKVQIEVQKLEV